MYAPSSINMDDAMSVLFTPGIDSARASDERSLRAPPGASLDDIDRGSGGREAQRSGGNEELRALWRFLLCAVAMSCLLWY